MDYAQHAHHSSPPVPATRSLDRVAFDATLHCLTGCAIGEVPGMMICTGLGWSNGATIALAVTLAFISGYAFTAVPLLRSGMPLRATARVALAADQRGLGHALAHAHHH